MKRIFLWAIFAIVLILQACNGIPSKKPYQGLEVHSESFNFYIVADVGRNGYFKQTAVAQHMGTLSESISPKFILSVGDCFHMGGVRSTQDPILKTNFEDVYSHPFLHCEWYPILGNHEYQGNTQAVIDYSLVSRRWVMPGRYYSKVFNVSDSTTLRIVAIDTPPIIEKYRKESEKYPDACKQNREQQIAWIDSVLKYSNATWNIVMGHHPILSEDTKSDSEKTDMIRYVKPLLEKYKVDFYISGHIHTMQHLQDTVSTVDYLVCPSGSLGRPALQNEHTKFVSADEGFVVSSVTDSTYTINVLNYNGMVVYTYTRKK